MLDRSNVVARAAIRWRRVSAGHWHAIDGRGVILAEAVRHLEESHSRWRFQRVGSDAFAWVKTLREAKVELQVRLRGLR